MLVEKVACGTYTYEDFAEVFIVEHLGYVVQNAPAGDHVEFVDVMLDVGNAAAVERTALRIRG